MRVVDVGSPDSSTLKLLETRPTDSANGRGYVTLSHCWGRPTNEEKEKFCTTKKNYKDRLKGFSIEDLPNTFQDAVQITRAIGQSYLWIDAVCIIQGDRKDWEIESLKMGKVFSSAYCTISADAAESWTEGFLRKSPLKFSTTFKDKREMYACSTSHDFENHVNNSKLNKRAWVLQERFLSRQIFHFAENHTYFACGESIRCENFTTLISPKRKEYYILDPQFPESLTVSGYPSTLEFIQHMFEEYAQAGLTKRSDKEAAISGLLQRMQDIMDPNGVHVIFHCFLSRLLLWRVSDTTDNPIACSGDTKHQLPSWSWMSHDHIHFFPEEDIEVPVGINKINSEGELHVGIFELRLRDYDMEEQGERSVLLRDNAKKIWKFWFDTHEQTQIQNCVIVGKCKEKRSFWKSDEVMWYVLLVTEGGEKRYKRVGVGKIRPDYISDASFGVVV